MSTSSACNAVKAVSGFVYQMMSKSVLDPFVAAYARVGYSETSIRTLKIAIANTIIFFMFSPFLSLFAEEHTNRPSFGVKCNSA
jgi:tetrahydromethanopterin S-methyltransferase subunit C